MLPLSVIVSQIKQSQNLVTLSNECILARRLCEEGFGKFNSITRIDKGLGGQTLPLDGAAFMVEAAIYNYGKRTGDYEATLRIRQNKDRLFETLFQDDPLAIAYLQSNGLMKAPPVNKNDVDNLRNGFDADDFLS